MTPALTPEVVAAELTIPLSTAREWMLRMRGVFRVGKHLRIDRLDFERWRQARKDAECERETWGSSIPGGGPICSANIGVLFVRVPLVRHERYVESKSPGTLSDPGACPIPRANRHFFAFSFLSSPLTSTSTS